jgi:hypothetical protein
LASVLEETEGPEGSAVALEVAAELLASTKLRYGVLLLVVVLKGRSHSECFLQLPPKKATEDQP